MTDEDNAGDADSQHRERMKIRLHREARRMRRELRQQRRPQRPPTSYLFWGLMLILWAVLISLLTQHRIGPDDLWKAFISGLGGIFIIRAVSYYFSPEYRSRALGSFISGLILTLIGLGFLFSYTIWLPVTLGVAGVAVIIVSYFLQREIQKRQATQEDLRESELKYRHIIDSANSVIMEMDTAGNVTFINRFAMEFFGYQEQEILGHNVVGTVFPADDSSASDLDTMVKDIVTSPERYLNNEMENWRKNGQKVWMIWTYRPILDDQGSLRQILCTAIDRTEQKKVEELAAVQMKERTAIEERTRLARDLHDAVSQTLFSTSLIAEVLPRVWERNKEEGLKKLEDVRQLSRGALAEMRTLLFELRPAALADADLNDLLHQLGESVFGRARVAVTVETNGVCDVPPDVKVALYRIAQEALNNVAKHSGASHAQVSLDCRPHRATLQIIDDGKGFATSRQASGSFGLSDMKERAEQIGASLEIKSESGQGTEITVDWHDRAEEVDNETAKPD
jgi:PAS domain S-box-containing protein